MQKNGEKVAVYRHLPKTKRSTVTKHKPLEEVQFVCVWHRRLATHCTKFEVVAIAPELQFYRQIQIFTAIRRFLPDFDFKLGELCSKDTKMYKAMIRKGRNYLLAKVEIVEGIWKTTHACYSTGKKRL